jgi:protease-4
VVWALRRLQTRGGVVLELDVDASPDPVTAAWLPLALRDAADDPRVVSVVMRLRSPPAGWGLTEDLRRCILHLEAHKTPVVVLLEDADTRLYWLASAASRVVMVPPGSLHLTPMGGDLTFFAAAAARVGVAFEVVSAGEYKAAGEPFTRQHASPAYLESTEAVIEALHETVVADIAASRSRKVEEIEALLREGPMSARSACEAGLVDEVIYEDQLVDAIDEVARRVDAGRWLRLAGMATGLAGWGRPGRVAVVHLHGTVVVEDDSGRGVIAARDVVPLLHDLATDDRIVAVVLEVDTSGGSALASDLIWRAASVLGERKPVIAAFGDVAASGGFYLAAAARRIVVRATTLTGSIGVVGGKVLVQEALRKIGVSTQPVGAGGGALSPLRPMSEDDRAGVATLMAELYVGFVQRVADGRGRPFDEVEPHCRGRVWAGTAALAVGLVDEEGDLAHAIGLAREAAGAPDAGVVHVQIEAGGWLQRLVRGVVRRQIGAQLPALWSLRSARALTWWSGDGGPR